MATNYTTLQGACPPPFLDLAQFPTQKGYVHGRLCSNLLGDVYCCLPCPATDWVYTPSFITWYRVAESLSAVGLVICVFLLLTWAVLPVEKTRRHYLSICLVIGIVLEGLSFVVPLAARPTLCYDAITPNDMFSDLTCAFSGTFVIAGGLAVTVWIFIRALSMHLQICWDIVPGKKYFIISQVIGWGAVGVFFTLTMTLTGVSYRFGETCLVNPMRSMGDFWLPLLTMAAFAGCVQILTFMYCIKVYVSSVWSNEYSGTQNSAGLPSYTSSIGAHSAKAVYQRVKKVLWLQSRSILIVVFLLVDIIFFSIVWIELDTAVKTILHGNVEHIEPFLLCLISHGGQRDKCYKLGQDALISQKTSVAVLILLSLTGIQTGLMLCRISMFTGWVDFFKDKFSRKREFVSLDAKRYSSDRMTVELSKVGTRGRVPTTDTMGTASETFSTKELASLRGSIAAQSIEREYRKPTMSFSGPRVPPSPGQRAVWEPVDRHSTNYRDSQNSTNPGRDRPDNMI